MKHVKGSVLVVLCVFMLSIWLGGCSTGAQNVAPTAVPVVTKADNQVTASGRLVPLRWSNLSFPNGGVDAQVLVEAGDVVPAGQVLARVKQDTLKLALEQAVLNQKRAELALKQLQELPSEEAVAAAKAALANADLNLRELEREGARQIKIDAAQSQVFSAMTNLEAIEKGATDLQLENAQIDIDAAKLAVEQAKASLEASEIKMPYDGQVIEVYLRNGETASPGQAVLLVADLSQMQVETTDLGEVDAGLVQPGNPAVITFDAAPNTPVAGKVVRIADKATSGSSIYVTVLLSLDEIPPNVRWGMTAFVEMTVK